MNFQEIRDKLKNFYLNEFTDVVNNSSKEDVIERQSKIDEFRKKIMINIDFYRVG